MASVERKIFVKKIQAGITVCFLLCRTTKFLYFKGFLDFCKKNFKKNQKIFQKPLDK